MNSTPSICVASIMATAVSLCAQDRGIFSSASTGVVFETGGGSSVVNGVPSSRRIVYAPSGDPVSATFKTFPAGSRYALDRLFPGVRGSSWIEVDAMSTANDNLPISPNAPPSSATPTIDIDPLTGIWAALSFSIERSSSVTGLQDPHLIAASHWPSWASAEIMTLYFDDSAIIPSTWYDTVLLDQSIRDDPTTYASGQWQDISAFDIWMGQFDEFGHNSIPWAKHTGWFYFSLTQASAQSFLSATGPGSESLAALEPFDQGPTNADMTGATVFRVRWDDSANGWNAPVVVRNHEALGLHKTEELDALGVVRNANGSPNPEPMPTIVFSTTGAAPPGGPTRPQLMVHHANQPAFTGTDVPLQMTTTGGVAVESLLGIGSANINAICGSDPEAHTVGIRSIGLPVDPNHPDYPQGDTAHSTSVALVHEREGDFYEIHVSSDDKLGSHLVDLEVRFEEFAEGPSGGPTWLFPWIPAQSLFGTDGSSLVRFHQPQVDHGLLVTMLGHPFNRMWFRAKITEPSGRVTYSTGCYVHH